MTSLNEIEAFLNIEIGDKKLRDGKKYKNKNQYYYYEQEYYIVKLTKDKWMILEDCKKTRVLLKKYCWSFHNHGYAQTNINKTTKKFHQLFLNYDKGLMADHINNNRYDNRLNNLRIVTCQENNRNKTKQTNNTSEKQGVIFYTHKKTGLQSWRVQIMNNNGKRIYKCFSIKKLGNDNAKAQAIAYRKQLEIQFNYIGD